MSEPNNFPEGWDEERVRAVIDAYEQQTDEEAVAEDEAAFDDDEQTFIGVPKGLVGEVRKLISRYRAS